MVKLDGGLAHDRVEAELAQRQPAVLVLVVAGQDLLRPRLRLGCSIRRALAAAVVHHAFVERVAQLVAVQVPVAPVVVVAA